MAQKKQKELGGNNMSTGTKVVIIVFAVIMALSMMLPTLASVVASNNAAEQSAAEEESTDSSSGTTESASGESSSGENTKQASEEAAVPDNETLKSLSTQYEETLAPYKERLANDSSNLAALYNLGQNYMGWGYNAYSSSTTDEEKAYSKGLLDKAVSYFDKYLALNDSGAVKVDRAMCSYYGGDTDKALTAIEKITKESPDNALAWVNLGILYEGKYESEKATDAYKKAIETDPDDEYGVKSYANKRLISINSTASSPADAGEVGAESLETTTPTGFSKTLSNDAGVGF